MKSSWGCAQGQGFNLEKKRAIYHFHGFREWHTYMYLRCKFCPKATEAPCVKLATMGKANTIRYHQIQQADIIWTEVCCGPEYSEMTTNLDIPHQTQYIGVQNELIISNNQYSQPPVITFWRNNLQRNYMVNYELGLLALVRQIQYSFLKAIHSYDCSWRYGFVFESLDRYSGSKSEYSMFNVVQIGYSLTHLIWQKGRKT